MKLECSLEWISCGSYFISVIGYCKHDEDYVKLLCALAPRMCTGRHFNYVVPFPSNL